MKKLIWIPLLIAMTMSGCNTGVVRDGKGNIILEVESRGMFRDCVYLQKNPDGTVIYYSSQSNTADILTEVNKFTGTAVGVARDIIP